MAPRLRRAPASSQSVRSRRLEFWYAPPVPYLLLLLAIIAEVTATSSLKASDQFTKLWPSLVVIVGYAISFFLLSIVVKQIPVSIAYAIWCGLGIVLVAVVGAIVLKLVPDAAVLQRTRVGQALRDEGSVG